MNQRMRIIAFVSVAGIVMAGMVLSVPARAASFPQKGKAIQVLVHFTAGGSSDVGARILASGLEKELGTSVVIVNKPAHEALTSLALSAPHHRVRPGCSPGPGIEPPRYKGRSSQPKAEVR